MAVWNGPFWAGWFRQSYLPEIASLREALLTRMLPALPDAADAGREAEAHADEAWDRVMAQPSDGSEEPGDYAEWALDQGVERYQSLLRVRQAVLNMGSVMLWHLLEQQMLWFHGREVLSMAEEQAAQRDPKTHNKLFKLEEFECRLKGGGLRLDQMVTWKKVDELRLVANTVKHGVGPSARQLHAFRPDLFVAPYLEERGELASGAEYAERPASGEDLYVTEADLAVYFDAATAFWNEFSTLIERVDNRLDN